MADNILTKLADLINPEVMADMISAKIPDKIRVAPFAKVDDTLAGVPGDTITVPSYGYIGDAEDVAEGVDVDINKMSTKDKKYKIKKAMKGVGLTDEAVLSGYGNPVGEANAQLALSIAAKIDNDCMEALQGATLVYDGTAAAIKYSGVVDAIDVFNEEINSDKVMFINPKQMATLRKDADFISADKYQAGVAVTGEIGKIANTRVVASLSSTRRTTAPEPLRLSLILPPRPSPKSIWRPSSPIALLRWLSVIRSRPLLRPTTLAPSSS